MCCLATVMVLLGPRLGIIVWGLAQPARWDLAFSTPSSGRFSGLYSFRGPR